MSTKEERKVKRANCSLLDIKAKLADKTIRLKDISELTGWSIQDLSLMAKAWGMTRKKGLGSPAWRLGREKAGAVHE